MCQSKNDHQSFQTSSSNARNAGHEIWLGRSGKTMPMLHLQFCFYLFVFGAIIFLIFYELLMEGQHSSNVFTRIDCFLFSLKLSWDKFCFSPLVFHNIYFATSWGWPGHAVCCIILLARRVSHLTWSKQAKLDISNL